MKLTKKPKMVSPSIGEGSPSSRTSTSQEVGVKDLDSVRLRIHSPPIQKPREIQDVGNDLRIEWFMKTISVHCYNYRRGSTLQETYSSG